MSAGNGDVLTARRHALAESGGGERVRLVQPRNLAFWAAVILFVPGITATYTRFRDASELYTESFVDGVAWFSIYALGFVWLFNRLDRYSSIPARVKVATMIFGGLVVTNGIAAPNNNAFRSILSKTAGIEFMNGWGAGLTAPWSEEIVKLLPVVLMIGIAPRVMRSAFSGLIVGAFSGLAFQVLEDVSYTYQTAAQAFGQTEAGINTLVLRSYLGLTHWPWAGVAGAGLIYLIGRPSETPRRTLGAAMILSSILLHFTWDSPWGASLYLPLSIINLAVFIWAYRMTVASERQWARALLAPEVEQNVISAEELEAAVGSRRQRRHYAKRTRHRRRERHVLESIDDLVITVARSGGAETDEVRHARSEIARLRG